MNASSDVTVLHSVVAGASVLGLIVQIELWRSTALGEKAGFCAGKVMQIFPALTAGLGAKR